MVIVWIALLLSLTYYYGRRRDNKWHHLRTSCKHGYTETTPIVCTNKKTAVCDNNACLLPATKCYLCCKQRWKLRPHYSVFPSS